MPKGSGLQKSAGRPPAVTDKSFDKAAVNSGGILSNIAKKLGVNRQSVYAYVQKNKERALPILKQESEKIIDMAENSLFNQVKEQEAWATKYLLATKGKHRGYVERVENQNLNVNVDVHMSPEELDAEVVRLMQ